MVEFAVNDEGDETKGRCAILLPHGVLNRMEEDAMRQKMIEQDMVDCVISIGKNLFYNSPMEACIMLCSSKKPKERQGQVLFIRATDLVERKNGESYLSDSHVSEIVNLYNGNTNVENRSCTIDLETIAQNRFSISPKLYVKQTQDTEIAETEDLVKTWTISSDNLHKEYDNLIKLF